MMPIPPSISLELPSWGWGVLRVTGWFALFCCAASLVAMSFSLGLLLLRVIGVV